MSVAPDIHITPREKEILLWLAEGKTKFETAIILGITEDTVNTHTTNARAKLNAVNSIQLIAKALRGGIIQ